MKIHCTFLYCVEQVHSILYTQYNLYYECEPLQQHYQIMAMLKLFPHIDFMNRKFVYTQIELQAHKCFFFGCGMNFIMTMLYWKFLAFPSLSFDEEPLKFIIDTFFFGKFNVIGFAFSFNGSISIL